MHSYTVTGAAYDGSGTDLNPGVWVWGTVDGYRTAYMAVYWAGIQQANQVAGQAGVQQYLAPILFAGALAPLGALTGPPSQSPVFESSNISVPVTKQRNGTSSLRIPSTLYTSVVACVEAMVPAWQQ